MIRYVSFRRQGLRLLRRWDHHRPELALGRLAETAEEQAAEGAAAGGQRVVAAARCGGRVPVEDEPQR